MVALPKVSLRSYQLLWQRSFRASQLPPFLHLSMCFFPAFNATFFVPVASLLPPPFVGFSIPFPRRPFGLLCRVALADTTAQTLLLTNIASALLLQEIATRLCASFPLVSCVSSLSLGPVHLNAIFAFFFFTFLAPCVLFLFSSAAPCDLIFCPPSTSSTPLFPVYPRLGCFVVPTPQRFGFCASRRWL